LVKDAAVQRVPEDLETLKIRYHGYYYLGQAQRRQNDIPDIALVRISPQEGEAHERS
jgi:hypothetical protein